MAKFPQLFFQDKWANRAMSVITVCLIVVLLVARESVAERVAIGIASAMLLCFFARGIYMAVRLHRGRPMAREPKRAVERRKRIDDWLTALWFCLALAIVIWKWIGCLWA